MDRVDRVDLLQRAHNNPDMQAALMEKCRRDPVFWFNTFCWTINPKDATAETPAVQPFNLYPFQEWAISQWYGHIEAQEHFGVEKSREMGASWMLILLYQYCFLFRPGWNFHVGSRKESEVCDATANPSTIFGKWRFNYRMLPIWMKPTVKAKTYRDKKLMFENKLNGNVVTGESSTPSFGRSGRYRSMMLDELAFWECADPAWTSAIGASDCLVAISTPFGETNKYGKLMNDPENIVHVYAP